jgi:hypothetical protein
MDIDRSSWRLGSSIGDNPTQLLMIWILAKVYSNRTRWSWVLFVFENSTWSFQWSWRLVFWKLFISKILTGFKLLVMRGAHSLLMWDISNLNLIVINFTKKLSRSLINLILINNDFVDIKNIFLFPYHLIIN